MDTFNLIVLICFILTPNLISIIVGFSARENLRTWYPTLIKPKLNPPNWIFGPVWFTLYSMIGISGYLVMVADHGFKSILVWTIYFLQLSSNYLWSILFFNMREMLYALYDIVILLMLIITNIVLFYSFSPIAGYLLIPYLLWVSFATYLNYSLWILNKGQSNDYVMIPNE
jgi:benzodiazapine receptor